MTEPTQDWHLDRRLQITHILSTLTLGVGAVLALPRIDRDAGQPSASG